jgi:hypothetical protein
LMLMENKADIIMADYWLFNYRLKFVDASVAYFSEIILFMIPPGATLTSFEKLFLPLDYSTWICLIFVKSFGFIVIFVLKKFSSNETQTFVFGSRVKQPSMNILAALFGGSQSKLPGRNFARFLLMMFILLCLVMRTLYAGSLFRIIQLNIHHKEAQTIDDMIEHDFKIYYFESMHDMLKGSNSKLEAR